MSLKDLIITLDKDYINGYIRDYDVREAFQDHSKWLKIIDWRANHIGQEDNKEILKLVNELTLKYECPFHELGFVKIFGDWDEE